MKVVTPHRICLGGRDLEYRVVGSRDARSLRLRVGPNGVEVVQPFTRRGEDVSVFLKRNEEWVLAQLHRVERLRGIRRRVRPSGEILFRGVSTRIRLEMTETRVRGNLVGFIDGEIVVRQGAGSRTPAARSLQNWLRKQARTEIEKHVADVTTQLRQTAQRVYVMGQRTKWGNCSARRNLSFNWRLILAPEFVLHYVVTHEAVHLAIPDHSAKFWLTVRSLCRETERAKQWLRGHQEHLTIDLAHALGSS